MYLYFSATTTSGSNLIEHVQMATLVQNPATIENLRHEQQWLRERLRQLTSEQEKARRTVAVSKSKSRKEK